MNWKIEKRLTDLEMNDLESWKKQVKETAVRKLSQYPSAINAKFEESVVGNSVICNLTFKL